MKKIVVIGGMGAGKSTAAHAIADQGIPLIDLDKVGHQVLAWDVVKEDLREAFGDEVFDAAGEVDRKALAARAFLSEHETHKLNNITMPRIEEVYQDTLASLEKDNDYVVVEYSVFKGRESSLAYSADVIIAITAPLEMRVARAVSAGWEEEDVRSRIARQITDASRIDAADYVFSNDSTPEALREKVLTWWAEYTKL